MEFSDVKQRLISSGVALVVLVIALCFFDTIAFNLIIGVLSAVAVYELLYKTQYVTNKIILSVSIVYSFLFPLLHIPQLTKFTYISSVVFVIILGGILLFNHKTVPFSSVCIAFLVSLMIPVSFSVSVVLRDRFAPDGLIYYFLALGGGWLCDAGAYFVGTAIGKHKLAPQISPKKTVEGAIGGVLVTVLGYMVIGFIYSRIRLSMGDNVQISYLILGVAAVICALSGMLGDLFASIIKRQTGIKDYGNIMPGHGGVMDRFDSVLFVSPIMFLIVSYFPYIIR